MKTRMVLCLVAVWMGLYGGSVWGQTGNTFVGNEAGFSNTTGSDNTFLGDSAGYNNSTGSGNVFLGYDAGYS